MRTVFQPANWKLILNLSLLFLLPIVLSAQILPQIKPIDGLVFEGKILSKKGYWSKDRSTIYTVNWFAPERIFDGVSKYQDSIPVITQGGVTDEGLLVVTHTSNFHKNYKYLMAIKPCDDCLSEFETYHPVGIVGEFQAEHYANERANWLKKTRSGSYTQGSPCPPEQTNLYLSFSNVTITSIVGQQVQGYVDIKTKTDSEDKILYDISSELKYDTTVFGQFAVANQNLEITPTDPAFQQHYTTTSQDQNADKVFFSMSKNATSGLNAIIINTFFQPTIRASFQIDASNITSIPQQLSSILELQNLTASYYCGGQRVVFDNIHILENPIGVIVQGAIIGITYTIKNVEFVSPDKYQFTVYVESDDLTQLRQSILRFDYSTFTFFPNQVAGGHAAILDEPGTIATDYPDYNQLIQDDGSGTFRVIIGDANVPDPGDEYAIISPGPIPLVRIEMTTQNCDANPMLAFQEFEMQEISFYYDEDNFPFFIMAYEPVIASDNQQVHPCGCEEPVINSFTPDEIVAGDNQILTITGSNFGVYHRTDTPGHGGTGSSVLFKNGDGYESPGSTEPEFIAASDTDIRFGGVLKWTDTEIKLRVPSTDYL